MSKFKCASIGCGVIGASYALKFAMGGYETRAHNRSAASTERAKEQIEESLRVLVKNGVMDAKGAKEVMSKIHFTNSIAEAVRDAAFIQESSAEHYDIKQTLVEQIEPYAPEDAIIASSTSGLLVTKIAEHARHPERFVGGHPYNPPHLIPLIEITRGEKTAEWAVKKAYDFYKSVGGEPVILKKEALGFICNRLQMALYREVCNLVLNGVCSVEDADKAVTFGPGIRWGIMGPSAVFELGGGKGGVKGLMNHLDESITLWLEDMADWKKFPSEWAETAQCGVNEELKNRPSEIGNTHDSLAEYRDKMLIEILKLHKKL